MLQRQFGHLNGRKLYRRLFKPLIFSLSVFVFSYIGNMFILMILYGFYLALGGMR
jgi:hypothetical protein